MDSTPAPLDILAVAARPTWSQRIARSLVCGILGLLVSHGAGAADHAYDIVPAPAWVDTANPPAAAGPDPDPQGGGAEYVLVDRQIRVEGDLRDYSHFVTRLRNVSGVEEHSQITIEFDPEREKLHMHSVVVRRGGETIDQLHGGRIRILQRESELEDGILDGYLTFHLLLDDVRVGDVIDYSYTLERTDPEWGDEFFGRYLTDWSQPILRRRLRLSVRAGAPVHIRSPREEPLRTETAGWQTYEWTKDHVAGIRVEKDAPGWFEQRPWVEFSQFATWREVAARAVPLFAVPDPETAPIRELAARLAAQGATPAERVVVVMKFVQDSIRYTGIEIGGGAFRPAAPQTVLHRRYGDCKDKTLLAVTLLRAMGIDAAPALVSTRWGARLPDHLPSPGLMDHAIVRVRIGTQVSWYDATVTGQGGGPSTFAQAYFGMALVVAADTVDLQAMPPPDLREPQITTRTTFDLSAGERAPATMTVSTTYLGAEADSMRRTLRRKTLADLQKEYLEYYKDRYPGIGVRNALRVSDDVAADRLVTDESYRVEHIFEANDEGRMAFSLHAESITEYLHAPRDKRRTTPLLREFPIDAAASILIQLPQSWTISDGEVHIRSAAFQYDSKKTHHGDSVELDYRYRGLADQVPPDQFQAFLKDLARAREDTYFDLTDDRQVRAPAQRKSDLMAFKIIAAAAGFFLLVRLLAMLVMVRAYLGLGILRVRAAAGGEDAAPAGELELLRQRDETLEGLGFAPLGFITHTPFQTFHRHPECVRILRHPLQPVLASVTRRADPEYGATVHVHFSTVLGDGRTVVTSDQMQSFEAADPQLLIESLVAATPETMWQHHLQRLATLRMPGDAAAPAAGAAPDSLEAAAAHTAAMCDATRRMLRARAWTVATSDPDLDRFTLKGAWAASRALAKRHGGRWRPPPPPPGGWPEPVRRARIEADRQAMRHLAWPLPSPRPAPWTLTALNAGPLLLGFALLGGIGSAPLAGVILAAWLLHEVGHWAAIWATGAGRADVFMLALFKSLPLPAAAPPRSVLRPGTTAASSCRPRSAFYWS
jgi:transglutaminase-like putative cysteine protease